MHFGTHAAADVLRRKAERTPLLAALDGCDRLILLGDLLELRHGPARDALRVAGEPLREIGAALGPGGEVVLVAGNHDHALIGGWLQRRGADAPPPALELETEVQWRAGEALDEVIELLAPARVRVAYPGVWLRPDVYATHGQYLDVHMTVPTLERLAAGVMARVVALDGTGPRRAEDYEAVLAPIYAWIDAVAQRADPARSGRLGGGSVRGWQALTGSGRRTLRGRATAAAWPAVIGGLNRAGLGPLRAELSGPALRRAGLAAMGEVVARLGIGAEYVLFGHTHRAGPLPSDDGAEWRTEAGPRLINTGCWVNEPAFAGPDPATSPYRAGFGVFVGDDGPPELRNLLVPERRAGPGLT